MILVSLFGLAVLHTAATECIAGDCMSDFDNPSGENFYYVNSFKDKNDFASDFFNHFNQIIREFSMQSNLINNIYQPDEFTNEANDLNAFYEYQPTTTVANEVNVEDEFRDFLNSSIPCGIQGRSRMTKSDSSRIVGGSNSAIGEFPWQISLQLVTGWTARHICGGSVVSENWVITAAHCVYGLSEDLLSVVAGKNDLYTPEDYDQRVNVKNIQFDGYNKQMFSRDIALLNVDPPLVLDGIRVSPICIPKPGMQFDNALAMVTGWGRVSESGVFAHVLQKVQLSLLPVETCIEMYKTAGYGDYVSPCILCGTGSPEHEADSCQGDSGGPLSCLADNDRFYLCGIVSWGLGCARPQYPGVYTAVSCYSNWVKNTVTYQ